MGLLNTYKTVSILNLRNKTYLQYKPHLNRTIFKIFTTTNFLKLYTNFNRFIAANKTLKFELIGLFNLRIMGVKIPKKRRTESEQSENGLNDESTRSTDNTIETLS